MVRLGLIGDNIKRSKSPLLHRLAGGLCGLEVTYEPLIPADMGMDFEAVFAFCQNEGFAGINITYPYKEMVFSRLVIEDPRVRAIGACNTVLFREGGSLGLNTDYTGFMTAIRTALGGHKPGVVAMAGAGGVGKAAAFGIAELGASELRIFDMDTGKANALADALRASGTAMKVTVAASIDEAVERTDGLVNCTPLGMDGIPGTAIPRRLIPGRRWAFDAVYTPVDTQFLMDARAEGVTPISGYELFFNQGVDAFRAFTGREVDAVALRAALKAEEGKAAA